MPEVQFITPAEKKAAEETDNEIEVLVDKVKEQSVGLETNFVRLGVMLEKVRNQKYWLYFKRKEPDYDDAGNEVWTYRAFGDYIKVIEQKVGRARSQLYSYIGVSEKLLPIVGEKNLAKIGITKALTLKAASDVSGQEPSAALIKKALDPKVTAVALKEAAFKEQSIHDDGPAKEWLDVGGFMCIPDEKKEILEAFKLACDIDPVIPVETSKPQKVKEILLRLSREFIGTYAHEMENV